MERLCKRTMWRNLKNVCSLFCTLGLIRPVSILLFTSPFFPSSSILSHPLSQSASLSPSAPSACRRDEVMHRRRGADPSPLAVPSLCPPLSHKHMGASLCQCPSQNTWLCLVTHGGQCTHTHAHTKTHTANLAWRAYPWLSPDVPHCEPRHQLWVIRTVRTPFTVVRTVLTVTALDGVNSVFLFQRVT